MGAGPDLSPSSPRLGQALAQVDGLLANGALQLLPRPTMGGATEAPTGGRRHSRLTHPANGLESIHVVFIRLTGRGRRWR
jgi:hypothetical protein